jgi:retron-type reverse transcriptase
MPGLDNEVLSAFDKTLTIARILNDLRSDFILSPHYNSIFLNASDELHALASEFLRSGKYNPELPNTISVPKERGFTRPGSILSPIDRYVYQAIIDIIAMELEQHTDRSRCFSQVLVNDGNMFAEAHECWTNFQKRAQVICRKGGYILKADIANYFERIPQHHLIGLMRASGCSSSALNLLEEMLLSFQERDSFGIIQGIYPSDLLGNFYLTDLDSYCELHELESARYVDDVFIRFENEEDARKGLILLIERLQKNGLHLNEYKSGIQPSEAVIKEETEVDRLFQEARAEVEAEMSEDMGGVYGFTADWDVLDADEEGLDEVVELMAVEKLFEAAKLYPKQADKIEKYCLPILRAAKSEIAINDALEKLSANPHMTRLYLSYLSGFVHDDKVVRKIEGLLDSSKLLLDYQRMYLVGALLNSRSCSSNAVSVALRWVENFKMCQETRAIAAIFAAKYGSAPQKRVVRLAYENEPSPYVRAAILYSARYFTPVEAKICRKAWGAHSNLNYLISKAMK